MKMFNVTYKMKVSTSHDMKAFYNNANHFSLF